MTSHKNKFSWIYSGCWRRNNNVTRKISVLQYISYIATWKQEIYNLWNRSGESWARTQDPLLHKPRELQLNLNTHTAAPLNKLEGWTVAVAPWTECRILLEIIGETRLSSTFYVWEIFDKFAIYTVYIVYHVQKRICKFFKLFQALV